MPYRFVEPVPLYQQYPYRSPMEETKDAHYIHSWTVLNLSLKIKAVQLFFLFFIFVTSALLVLSGEQDSHQNTDQGWD